MNMEYVSIYLFLNFSVIFLKFFCLSYNFFLEMNFIITPHDILMSACVLYIYLYFTYKRVRLFTHFLLQEPTFFLLGVIVILLTTRDLSLLEFFRVIFCNSRCTAFEYLLSNLLYIGAQIFDTILNIFYIFYF